MTDHSPDAIALPSGQFAMVALDQRESLCAMLRRRGKDDDADAVTRFKLAVVRALGPYASGLLIDREYGYDRVVADRLLPDSCGLILAGDLLDQPYGEPVRDTAFDTSLDLHAVRADGTVALKLLVLWKRDGRDDERVADAATFVERCRAAGLVSVLEGVTSPVDDDAVVEAARALGGLRPDVYKVQVPSRGTLPMAEQVRACERVDAVLDVPWVVLSNGVEPRHFPHAVEAACRAGASGFLAGRAVWTGALHADDLDAGLGAAAEGLRSLVDTVSRYGRPWRVA